MLCGPCLGFADTHFANAQLAGIRVGEASNPGPSCGFDDPDAEFDMEQPDDDTVYDMEPPAVPDHTDAGRKLGA